MDKTTLIYALGLFNLAVFILSTLFLPSAGSFSYQGPISYYVNTRTDWHIAFGVTLATALISWGVYLIVTSFERQKNDE